MLSFLLSVPRSGSTLVSLLLNNHDEIHCPPEPWVLLGLEALGQVHPEHPADSPFLAAAISEFLGQNRPEFVNLAANSIYQQALQSTKKSWFIDKTPRYYLYLDLIREAFPKDKAILLLRNPLDVAASYLTTWNINLAELIRDQTDSPFLFDYVLGFKYLVNFQSQYISHVVHYEQLVTDPKKEMDRVFTFLNIKTEAVSTEVHINDSAHIKSGFGDKKIISTTSVHSNSINSYKNVFTDAEIAILLSALGENLFNELGYLESYKTALQELSLIDLPINHCELVATAENYLLTRKDICKLSPSNNAVKQQLRKVTEDNASLNEQLKIANQYIHFLNNRGLKARALDLATYSKRRVKHIVDKVLWRIVSGKSKQALPSITLITPVFNGGAHITETIESVLRQEYPALEYIIIDGGSTDNTLDIISAYKARNNFPQKISLVISESDKGMYDAIAKGFERANGEIFCYLNADDLLETGALNAVGQYFSETPNADVIYHEDTLSVGAWRFCNIRQPKRVRTSDLLQGHILFQDGVFFRRQIYDAVGGIRRDLKYAGDYDLWLRMSALTKFIKRPGHVSCFRIRSGQLSENMELYKTEMGIARQDFLKNFGKFTLLKWQVAKCLRSVYFAFAKLRKNDRLFFPIDFSNLPPPAAVSISESLGISEKANQGPCSPIDSIPAGRLLFSTIDNRFGEREINHIYLDSKNEIAIAYPPLESQKLDALYKTYYSAPPTSMETVTGTSPYKGFDRLRFWEKWFLYIPIGKFARLFGVTWADKTLTELTSVLQADGVNTSLPLRFLDTGCFEGKLLDQIVEQKPWVATGLEPNETAVNIARAKGHVVLQGHAEDAVEIIPEEQQFDVIFMGQSIEHVDDPLRVLRRLRLLLAPGGVLVLSTPNLGSREIDWFGPTWAHWHPPYHRYIFSRRGLESLANRVGLRLTNFKSFSHPYWTAMSIALNKIGLSGSVSNAIQFDKDICDRAIRISILKSLIYDRVGQGDYCYVVLKES